MLDKSTADTGQMSKAKIAMKAQQLYLSIQTVSLRISNAFIDWIW